MTLETEPRIYKISSPDNPEFEVGVNTLDAADPDSMFTVTVHKTDNGSAGNVWHTFRGIPNRVIPEWELHREPDPAMLLGTILSLKLQIVEKGIDPRLETGSDLRLRLAAITLGGLAQELVKNPDQKRIVISTPSARSPMQLRNTYAPGGKNVETVWGFHNEAVASYEKSFENVLGGKSLTDLIRTRAKPIVIDLMAPPRTVYDLLRDFPSGRGLAVSLPDHRVSQLREDIQVTYDAKNVKWLPEDITRSSTWKHVEHWLQGSKAHLVMERAMVGLESLPIDKNILGTLLNKAWRNLDPNGGVFLFETPPSDQLLRAGIDINAWVDSLRGSLDVKYDPGDPTRERFMYRTGKIMIVRSPSSPRLLPSI